MSEKNKKRIKKGWIIALAAALILVCALFTANAATDGALFDGTILHTLKIIFNGEEYELDDYLVSVENTVDEDGNPVVHHSYGLSDDVAIDVYQAQDRADSSADADVNQSIYVYNEGESDVAADDSQSFEIVQNTAEDIQ